MSFMRLKYIVLLNICVLGCSPYKAVDVISENYNSRIDYIVLHATSQNFAESLATLTMDSDYPVSSHYLLPRLDDGSYDRNDLAVYRLVPEHERAWHAGRSYWANEDALNDRSIGIEVVNEFACIDHSTITQSPSIDYLDCEFLPYPEHQVELLITLLKDILLRYPDINPIDIVGHADIAPMRKSDPGPYFPWQQLYAAGIGAWYDEETVEKYLDMLDTQIPSTNHLQQALVIMGYPLEENGIFDEETRYALRAFQLHYRPSDYSGKPDIESAAILFALIEKYRDIKMLTFLN
jgi:N-acetylmuramoyl-L-alanine amidase